MNFEKTYLSREMTRAMSLDHPIGDPTGGPAYGERREPVSAVLAIGSMVAGYGAATAAGATMAAMVLGGMAMAGGALSLVGNVTGNAKLQKFGSIVGLVGGAGLSLGAMGAFSLTETPAMAAAGASSSAGGEVAANTAADTGAQVQVNSAPATPTPEPTVLDTPNPTAALNAPTVEAPAALNAPTVQMPAPELVGSSPATSFDSFGNPVAAGSPAALSADPSGLAQAQIDATAAAQQPGLIQSAWNGVKDVGSGFMNFTKTNPMGAYVAAQAIGGAADALSGKSSAQKKQLEADANLRQANADKVEYEMELAKRKLAALNENYKTVNAGVQVNPNAQVAVLDPRSRFAMLPPAQTGLIAGNRA